jgi:hypothetical protein
MFDRKGNKPITLKFESRTILSIDYGDWDNFVNDYFGFEMKEGKYYRPYEIAADEELGNDMVKEFSVGEFDKYNRKVIAKIIDDNVPLYCTQAIINYFGWKGIINKNDEIQIVVSW